MSQAVVDSGYLIGAILFIIALKLLNSPATARKGNWVAAVGMGIALLVTLAKMLQEPDVQFPWLLIGVTLGAVVGVVSARRVQMTAMPQMVALFNGVGGGAVALVALIEFTNTGRSGLAMEVVPLVTAVL